MRWDGEVDVLQVVGKKPGKTRATVVLEPRRREAVPKCTESRGPGFSCQTPKASSFHGSGCSKGEPSGLCLKHREATRLEGQEEPPRMSLGTMWATVGCPTLTTACLAGATLSSMESRAQPIVQMERLRARGGQGWI